MKSVGKRKEYLLKHGTIKQHFHIKEGECKSNAKFVHEAKFHLASASSEDSGESVQMHRLTTAFTPRIPCDKVWM